MTEIFLKKIFQTEGETLPQIEMHDIVNKQDLSVLKKLSLKINKV